MWKRRRLTAKRYPGDNRLIFPKSPYRRDGLAPRCRLVASWGWSRSQGLGCSPIKAVRELGLERRETVRTIAVYKSGQMLEHPVNPSLPWRKAAVTMCRVRKISRKDRVAPSVAIRNPQRLYAGRRRSPKIQSELHGDMQSRAEMIRPRDSSRE